MPAPGAEGLQVHLADRRHFGAALLFATGAAAHLDELRRLAQAKGMRLEPHGLHKGRSVVAAEEAEIYRALGLPYIDPELPGRTRGNRAGSQGKLPKLVTDKDLRGILHCHTDASDGTETLETMAKATRQRGFEYFGVADHSKSAHYAGGFGRADSGAAPGGGPPEQALRKGFQATKSMSRRCSAPAPSTMSPSRSTPTPGGSIWIGGGIRPRSISAA